MIERLYIDHFKTFQNFEWKPGPVALLLGRNGTGKTTLFEVLHLLQSFACEELPLQSAFPPDTCTRWDLRKEQRFELDAAHVMFREKGGPTRIQRFASNEAIPPSEVVARGGLPREGGGSAAMVGMSAM